VWGRKSEERKKPKHPKKKKKKKEEKMKNKKKTFGRVAGWSTGRTIGGHVDIGLKNAIERRKEQSDASRGLSRMLYFQLVGGKVCRAERRRLAGYKKKKSL